MHTCAAKVPTTTSVDSHYCPRWLGAFGWTTALVRLDRACRRNVEHPQNALHPNPAVRLVRPVAGDVRRTRGIRALGSPCRTHG